MRKTLGIVTATLLATLGTMGASAATSQSEPWPSTNGSASQSRANDIETTLTQNTVAGAGFRRAVAPALGAPVLDEFCQYESPVVSSPIFTSSHLLALDVHRISEFDPSTGRLIRHMDLAADVSNRIAVSGGRVIAAGANCDSVSDPNGNVQAFNSSTGALVWSVDPEDGVPFDMVASGQYVVITGGGEPGESWVYVLRASDGSTVWTVDPPCPDTAPAVVAGGEVLVATCIPDTPTPELVAYNLATGAVSWTRPGNWQIYRADSDTASLAQIYATAPNGRVVALGSQGGSTLYPMAGATDVLAAGLKRVYANCGSDGAQLCAYNKTNGALEWRVADKTSLVSAAGGVLYLDTGAALNAATGKLLKRLWGSTGTVTDLAVGDGLVATDSHGAKVNLYGLPGD